MITKEQFTKMSKARRRVFLAKDVIAQLFSGKYHRSHITYLSLFCSDSDGPLKDFINQPKQSCFVCAKGALVCSYIRHFNGFSKRDIEGITGEYSAPHFRILRELFGNETWNRIEELYEGKVYAKDGIFYHDKMIEIMQNIIDNKGELTL